MMTKYEQLQEHLKSHQYSWLITGVAGFIGSNLLEKLLILNQKVIGLDNFETGYQHNIDQAIEDAASALKTKGGALNIDNFSFIEGDMRDLETCKKAMCLRHSRATRTTFSKYLMNIEDDLSEGGKRSNTDGDHPVDFVLHQAALGSVPRSIADPIHTNKANIDGFLNMLVAARDAKVKRFVYAASSSTYGDHPDLPKVEDKIGNPLSPYSVTKVVNELYASVFAKTYGFKTIGLRYFNIFGKRQNPNGAYAAVIPKWVSTILSGEEIFINGDGETSRDFCYIDNSVQMNLLAAMADNDEAADQVYNVALNDQTTLTQLYHMIEDRLIERVEGLTKKEPIYREFRAGDVRHSRADISKAQQLLGYQPSHKIEKGLDEAMDWYVEALVQ